MASLVLERDTELLVNTELTNLGWDINPHSKGRNVYVQKAKTLSQRQLLGLLAPDYTLYKSGSDEPIAVIEAKRPGQKIHDALEQGANYAEIIGAPIVFATDGVFTKTLHIVAKKPLLLNGEEVDELLREAMAVRFLATNEVTTLDKKVVKSRSELISIFDTVNQRLREEGLQQGLERFTEFANILFLKVLSEVEDAKEQQGERSKVGKEYRWEYFRNLKGPELLSYVSDTVLRWFANAYQDENIFQPLQIRHPDNLRDIIGLLDGLQLTDINADIKGDAFEYFIRAYSASNPSDLGEIFTPRHIVKTVVKLLNPQIGETVYDPFCGTGGMLTVAFKHLMSTMPRNDRNIKTLQRETIYGADLTKTASIAKMNMILAGDGHNNIVRQDSLANPVDDLYDIVLTNMPFAQTTRYGDKYTIPSRNGDIICPQHCFRATKQGGRMAIIVPEGFIANTNAKIYQDIRHYLLDNATLKSIVSLPRGAFEPYNRAKADILYFVDVKNSRSQGHYWYFDVQNDGFTLDKRRRRIEGGNDLEIVLSERREVEREDPNYLASVGVIQIQIADVRANKFALNAAYYREPLGIKPKYPTVTFGELFEPAPTQRIGNLKDAPIMSMTMKEGLIDQARKFIKRIASADISDYKKVNYGELVMGFPIDEGVLGFQLKYPYAAVSPAYNVFRLKRTDIDPKFLELVLRSQEMRAVYKAKMQSAVDRRRHIEPDVMAAIKVPIPPEEIREKIVRRYTAMQEAKEGIERLEYSLESGLQDLWSVSEAKAPRPSAEVTTGTAYERFAELAQEWKQSSAHIGSMSLAVMHPSYQRIIGMGLPAVPFLLHELQNSPDHWFWALYAITGVNPVPKDAEGNFKAMTGAWLEWGKAEGFI